MQNTIFTAPLLPLAWAEPACVCRGHGYWSAHGITRKGGRSFGEAQGNPHKRTHTCTHTHINQRLQRPTLQSSPSHEQSMEKQRATFNFKAVLMRFGEERKCVKISACTLVFASCQREDSNNRSSLQVFLWGMNAEGRFFIKEMPTKPEEEINFFLHGFVCHFICHLFICPGCISVLDVFVCLCVCLRVAGTHTLKAGEGDTAIS